MSPYATWEEASRGPSGKLGSEVVVVAGSKEEEKGDLESVSSGHRG